MTGLEITIAVLLASNVVTLWLAGRCHMRALSAEIDLSVARDELAVMHEARHARWVRISTLASVLEWYANPANWKGTAGKHSEAYADKGGRAKRIVTWHKDHPV